MTGSVTLAVDGQLIAGMVVSPEASLGLFQFVPDEPDSLDVEAEEGMLVRLQWKGRSGFDAEAEVLECDDPERWILSVPAELDPTQQRQSRRIMADGAWSLRTEEGVRLEVFDVSARGIGLEFPAGDGPAGVGDTIEGVLSGQSFGQREVRVECTNVRPHPDDSGLWIVGGRLKFADEASVQAYQSFLQSLIS